MKNLKQYKFLSLALMLAYVLSACSGVPAGPGAPSSQNGQSQEVVFSGTVEVIGAGQWTVSGKSISLSSTTAVDTNIQLGDNVKVEAVVSQDGTVTAVRIESAGADDVANGNSNDDNVNDINANDNPSNSNDGQADNSNSDNNNTNVNDNGNDNTADGPEQEVFGTVQAITAESITINGIVYMISDFTEFKDLIVVGDTVKLHVIVNADGTFAIREIEKSTGAGDDDNSNSNGSDDNSNDSNEHDDSNDDNSNGDDDNGNDDDGDDDHNDNDSESNDND